MIEKYIRKKGREHMFIYKRKVEKIKIAKTYIDTGEI